MIGVVVFSRRFHINPDNVATPIAASLGDLTTISLLAAVSMFLFNTRGRRSHLFILLFSLIGSIAISRFAVVRICGGARRCDIISCEPSRRASRWNTRMDASSADPPAYVASRDTCCVVGYRVYEARM
jgi:hypothetical protein